MELEKTVERIVPQKYKSRGEYLLYLRHVFVYEVLKSKLKATDHLLEIGFGEGYGTHLISGYVDSIIGLDVEKKTVEYANKKYGSEICSFQTYDGSKIPFEENTFNSIVSYQVIEHVEKDENFLKEIHRVLRNEGTLYLTTPNRLHRLAPGEEPWNPFHEREYSPDQLKDLLDDIFSEVKLYGVNAEEDVWQIEVDRVKRGITLKKLIPNTFDHFIYGDFMSQYDTDSFFLDEDASTGLDLFAICTKKSR